MRHVVATWAGDLEWYAEWSGDPCLLVAAEMRAWLDANGYFAPTTDPPEWP